MFFFPFKDDNPTKTSPIISYIIIFICCLIYLFQSSLSQNEEFFLIKNYGATPILLMNQTDTYWYSSISSMFLHGGLMHLLFNMFGVWMFGAKLEQIWGPKRFLQFYFFSALGAFLLHFGIVYFQIQEVIGSVDPQDFQTMLSEGRDILMSGQNYQGSLGALNANYNVPVLGASGALFGILVAFAIYWPNTELYLMFIPIPIKAKYAVIGYAAYELFSGISGFSPGIAHFAHIGGALFGYLLVTYWNRNNRTTFY